MAIKGRVVHNARRRIEHDVYWRSHGCKRTKGHANPCVCTCGDVLKKADTPYGDDAETAVAHPHY